MSFFSSHKAKLVAVIGLGFNLLSNSSFAADATSGFSTADLVTASQVALKLFIDENGAHSAHVTGFKTWKTGSDAKVKVYMNHDGMTMEHNYQCALQGSQVMCSAL